MAETLILVVEEEAINKVEENNPDLVLMDIVLQGEMDGIETAEQIRTRFSTPVVYLTAYSDDRTLLRALPEANEGDRSSVSIYLAEIRHYHKTSIIKTIHNLIFNTD